MEEALWTAYRGSVPLSGIAPYCVIDRCAASVGDVTFRCRTGGERTYGKRPLEPDGSLRQQQRGFFDALKASLEKEGQKVPVLIWCINQKLYCRYGASRIFTAKQLGWKAIDAVICSFDYVLPAGLTLTSSIGTNDPCTILGWFNPTQVVVFECSHERLDVHRVEPLQYAAGFRGI